MSPSIRPPGGPSAPGAAGVESIPESRPSQAAEVSEAGSASQAAPATAPENASAALLSRLQAGEVTREQAIEGLVSDALEVHGGARLAPPQRAELQAVLRAALLDDPVLGRLLG